MDRQPQICPTWNHSIPPLQRGIKIVLSVLYMKLYIHVQGGMTDVVGNGEEGGEHYVFTIMDLLQHCNWEEAHLQLRPTSPVTSVPGNSWSIASCSSLNRGMWPHPVLKYKHSSIWATSREKATSNMSKCAYSAYSTHVQRIIRA